MKSVNVEKEKIDLISDFISRIISDVLDDDAFEGAYVSCFEYDDILKQVSLNIVSNYGLKIHYTTKELDELLRMTGVAVCPKVVPYLELVDARNFTHKAELKVSRIICDKHKNLLKVKNHYHHTEYYSTFEIERVTETLPPIEFREVKDDKIDSEEEPKRFSLSDLEVVPYEESIPYYLEQNRDILMQREAVRVTAARRAWDDIKDVKVGSRSVVCPVVKQKSVLEQKKK